MINIFVKREFIMIELLFKIPDAIWGVLLGSGLTLFGTFLQGRKALQLLLKQKELDADNAHKDRDFNLKKENYINSLKVLTQLVNVLMDFTKPGQDFDEFGKEIQRLFIQLCSIDLVADKETLDPMHKFQKYYFNICMELITDKIPFESLVTDKNSKNNWCEYYNKLIDENISLINNNPHTGTDQDQEYQVLLTERYEEYCQERDKYSKDAKILTQKLLKIEIDFKRKAVEKTLMINQFLKEYIQSARNGLGLEAIPIEYSQVNAFHENLRSSIEKTFLAVEEMNKGKGARKEE